MNIYYDNIIFSLQNAGGISVYWHEIIKRLIRDSIDVNYFEKGDLGIDCKNIFRRTLEIPKSKIILEPNLPNRLLRYLPCLHSMPPKSVYHGSYYRPSLQKDIRQIVTVFDFMYEHYRNGIKLKVHHWQKKSTISFSDIVICISNNTKNDLCSYFPWLDESRIKVIHLAASEEFKPLSVAEKDLEMLFPKIAKQVFAIYIGDRRYYKNFNIAVETISEFSNLGLLAVGGGDLTKEETVFVEKFLPGRFTHLMGINGTTLNQLYNNAHALLYPSVYEGFGIPILEAMQAGCPVVSVMSSSIPEIASNACYLAPLEDQKPSLEYFRNAVQALFSPGKREEIILKGIEQARKFSWEKCYKETINLYE